jgi:hypothetical protein
MPQHLKNVLGFSWSPQTSIIHREHHNHDEIYFEN